MRAFFTSICIYIAFSVLGQSDCIHTSGKYILGPCGDTLILRGVNYAPYNWGYDVNELHLEEIAASGANSVRLPWYQNGASNTIYNQLNTLEAVINKCILYGLIPVLELHDYTCKNDASALQNSLNWWNKPEVVTLLTQYKHSVIVNIANEALYVNWTANPTTALADYVATYQNIITSLRSIEGFNFPIMIDAPDCGQTSDAFITTSTAQTLIDIDPQHNLIFSAHAYWYAYANNNPLQMGAKIDGIVAQNIPFVLGEIANQQDGAQVCQYDLNYKGLLEYCEKNNVGWLAWSWDRDVCPNRQITTNGLRANLTAYGEDILNNPIYGLARGMKKSSFLANNLSCGATASLKNSSEDLFTIYPTVVSEKISVLNSKHTTYSFELRDIKGSLIFQKINSTEKEIDLSQLEKGMYYLIFPETGQQTKIIKN